jgi:hypothetical protein
VAEEISNPPALPVWRKWMGAACAALFVIAIWWFIQWMGQLPPPPQENVRLLESLRGEH